MALRVQGLSRRMDTPNGMKVSSPRTDSTEVSGSCGFRDVEKAREGVGRRRKAWEGVGRRGKACEGVRRREKAREGAKRREKA